MKYEFEFELTFLKVHSIQSLFGGILALLICSINFVIFIEMMAGKSSSIVEVMVATSLRYVIWDGTWNICSPRSNIWCCIQFTGRTTVISDFSILNIV
jgi:hypothetical protein